MKQTIKFKAVLTQVGNSKTVILPFYLFKRNIEYGDEVEVSITFENRNSRKK